MVALAALHDDLDALNCAGGESAAGARDAFFVIQGIGNSAISESGMVV